MHSEMYEKINKFYALHLYTKEQVMAFVERNVISLEEYNEIVGDSK